MFIKALIGASLSKNLLINFSVFGLEKNISALFFNRVVHTSLEKSRKVLAEHTVNDRKHTLQVQKKKQRALMYHNLIGSNQTQTLKLNVSFFNSHAPTRKSTK